MRITLTRKSRHILLLIPLSLFISTNDVNISWKTMGEVDPNGDNQVVVKITITHEGQILFHQRESFTENLFSVVRDALSTSSSGQ